MPSIQFYLLGQDPATGHEIEVNSSEVSDYDSLRLLVAGHFAVLEPSGIDFSVDNETLTGVSEIINSQQPVAITIDGKQVRDVPGPKGFPYIGNYYEIYPDHLGNHQRLFDTYGPVFKTSNFGSVVYQTNDPVIANHVFNENGFFTKQITPEHPLFGIMDQEAGLFLADTDTEAWRLTHKFLPPAFSPKAVRHYSPKMQQTVESAYKVFDQLDEQGDAFNVYLYMLKLGSQAVGQLTLGLDFNHFSSVYAPMHKMVRDIAELLELNKKVSTMGAWYSYLPFGDPARLRHVRNELEQQMEAAIAAVTPNGVEDLELQDAALKASCIADYAVRAVDNQGEKLPKRYMSHSIMVATAAGFTTTSSLLSWLLYGLTTYEGMQERLLQELIDNDIDDDTVLDADIIGKLPFLDKYVKEMQRKHNPSYQPGRTAQHDLILPGGYKIPKGGIVIPALHHIHNNPNLWDNPAKFNPDRWDTEEVKNRHRSAYVPFAQGPRGCIGFNFALLEVKIFLPKLVYRYHWSKVDEEAVEYDPFFQLIRPTNFMARAERRVKWPAKSA
ncbi:cytochrome P450 [Aureobasidium namibiae CBS 147.97]|uniref:Cytochrome P450 n=1 Tax=Aureobasidium namibiae CBS 147.97 TaxID=1043004 RepID=A0A074W9G0_9PEZI